MRPRLTVLVWRDFFGVLDQFFDPFDHFFGVGLDGMIGVVIPEPAFDSGGKHGDVMNFFGDVFVDGINLHFVGRVEASKQDSNEENLHRRLIQIENHQCWEVFEFQYLQCDKPVRAFEDVRAIFVNRDDQWVDLARYSDLFGEALAPANVLGIIKHVERRFGVRKIREWNGADVIQALVIIERGGDRILIRNVATDFQTFDFLAGG